MAGSRMVGALQLLFQGGRRGDLLRSARAWAADFIS